MGHFFRMSENMANKVSAANVRNYSESTRLENTPQNKKLLNRIRELTRALHEIRRIIRKEPGEPLHGYTIKNVVMCVRNSDPFYTRDWGEDSSEHLDWMKAEIKNNSQKALKIASDHCNRGANVERILINEICLAPSPATIEMGIAYFVEKGSEWGLKHLKRGIYDATRHSENKKFVLDILTVLLGLPKYQMIKNNEQNLEITYS